jgi:signal transduction histidine kinase
MIRKIYIKLILVFLFISLVGNAAAFSIASFTTEHDLARDMADLLAGAADTARDVYGKGGTPVDTIERLSSSGFILVKFYKDAGEVRKKYPLSDEELAGVNNAPAVFELKGADKSSHKSSVGIVRAGEGYIVATLSAKGLLVSLRELLMRVCALSLIIGCILMIAASGIIVKPVRKLSAATEKIARGDFDIRIENNRNDEIGQLIENFNIMAKELSGMEMLRNNFISDISHEFRTPLTSIEGYARLLRGSTTDAEREEYTGIIMEETKRLSALSGNILLLNRIENENISLTKSTFRLDEQIRQVILSHESKWSSKDIDLQLDLDECLCEGNEQLLYQVWLNLFDNAVKFSKPRGVIEVTLRKLDGRPVFTITDYGKGMTDEEQARMFEKFFTGDRSRNTEGNGLGLSIVKRVVDMHRGKLEITSKHGEFTQIKVIL